MKKKRKKKSLSNMIVDIVVYSVVGMVALCCLYPFIYTLSMSVSEGTAVLTNEITLLPKGFSLDTYWTVLKDNNFINSLGNAVFYTITGTLFQVTGTFMYGYILSRKDFVLRKFYAVFSLIPLMFGGGLIPSFLVIRDLGLYNTFWALILPGGVSIWNALIAKAFFQNNVSDDLLDAARIDGCDHFGVFLRIVVPLSGTIVSILTLYAAVGFWNDYLGPLIYLQGTDKKVLQVLLAEVLVKQDNNNNNMALQMVDKGQSLALMIQKEKMKYVLVAVSSLPILVMYPFLQKFFVKGVMIGSVKG